MSYILEALRKADAERGRGSVPDLNAQLLPRAGPQAQAEPPRSPLVPWLVIGVLLSVVGGGAWRLSSRDEPAATPAATPAVPPGTARVPATAAPSVQAMAVPPLALAPSPEPAASQAAPPGPVAAPAPKLIAKAKPASAPPAGARMRAAPASTALAPEPEAQTPSPPARLLPLAELPGELRQQVPPLVIGGSVYSPQASARMVVVNGQVFQEGNNLAPELKLEQIRQKTAVFSIRGQRFEVPL
jgi:general secretion pathway protein B